MKCFTDVCEGLARLELLHEVIASTNWTLNVEPLRLHDVSFSYMQLRNLDTRNIRDKYIVLDLSTTDVLATVLKQVSKPPSVQSVSQSVSQSCLC